ncbi:MAG: helix-turn-helix transcriptional regulator [Symploca sp. SIO2E6]|nr:helix-turn-helix transcriptional regulator [Symploca sp. SIO2E6]
MARKMKDFIASLPDERQQRIKERSEELLQEHMALQELRKAMAFTQEQIAQELGMDQGNLSKLERRTDLMLSTLRRYIEAMGGSLRIIAEFPEKPPIEVTGFENTF